MKHPLSVVILAAGLGTRMKSSTPKVMHKIYGKPIIQYTVDSAQKLKPENTTVVVSPDSIGIKNTLEGYRLNFAVQKKSKGTGDALKTASGALKNFRGITLVLNGDTPLITSKTLKKLLGLHDKNRDDISVLSFIAEGEHSYGRIVREKNKVKAIIEDKDADAEQKEIKEVNSGIYAMKPHVLNLLKDVQLNKGKGEYYLTDIVGLAVKKGHRVNAYILGNETEMTGINTREDLSKAGLYIRDMVVSGLMHNGVSFMDASSVFIHPEAKIEADTIIYPNVHIEGKTVIGKGCTIYPNSRITDSNIGNNVVIKDSTVIECSTVKDKAAVGPFAHIRPGSSIGPSSKVGNFVEIKKSVIGEGTKASHLSYIGDAEIGRHVNIGAGTITCNYDGKNKHKTVIEDDVFVGSDSQIIAPVKVGKGAYVGAGSTITKNVPPLSLAVSRTEQRHIEKWALKKRLRVKNEESEIKKIKTGKTKCAE
ncbi:MAG: bifunctional UDP-N-acetylglucosamine diphosphorylase/glucosamine-1-phosphate N-acetyltransferase GlmU [Nitrospirae bacterium]|nr:bifunctional UDP-N-acetylglucosamine diphosphorylase/glucosamine-1-phosphate N-acetyltransferase GlmU [Nitrospirota bacterium]MCL5977123.1 bifunctional UDP-N-acetylglucosamine diphosphorylase/glucosamine-1-phosphate N-acetyltransferase GlmU [Nitrospirota bacterium]